MTELELDELKLEDDELTTLLDEELLIKDEELLDEAELTTLLKDELLSDKLELLGEWLLDERLLLDNDTEENEELEELDGLLLIGELDEELKLVD